MIPTAPRNSDGRIVCQCSHVGTKHEPVCFYPGLDIWLCDACWELEHGLQEMVEQSKDKQ